jgi:predicted Fe-Mo cluster-binding NifX family protein
MKIIFTAKGTGLDSAMDPRFGRTEFFVIYDEGSESIDSYDNRAIENEAHGAGPKTAQKLAEYGAQVLITGNGPGNNAARVLQTAGTRVYVGAGDMTVREALEAYKKGDLKKF